MSTELQIALVAAAWAGGVGALGLAGAWLLRGTSLRWMPVGVAVVAVVAVVAGVIGTSRAMFLAAHDYAVVLRVCAVAGVVSIGFAALVGRFLARWSGRLHEGARQFAASGTYDGTVRGPAEFASLSEQLRETSDHLAASRAREQHLEDSRRELVSWVSHDLRTPLAGMRAMAEALEDGMVDDPARYYRQIRTEVDRTVRMVDDLFELSQIHAGLLAPELECVELDELVGAAVAAAESVAAAKGVRLREDVEVGVLLNADPAALSRVIGNLLMNAIRHTPRDGAVQVQGRLRGNPADPHVEITVSDACGGIPDETLGRVFDVAFRGADARTPEPGSGAGLGLAIVRGIVEAHRGRVEVANTGPGCRFLVQMPTAERTA